MMTRVFILAVVVVALVAQAEGQGRLKCSTGNITCLEALKPTSEFKNACKNEQGHIAVAKCMAKKANWIDDNDVFNEEEMKSDINRKLSKVNINVSNAKYASCLKENWLTNFQWNEIVCCICTQ